MENEKKFKLPEHLISVKEFSRLVEDEINKLHAEIERFKKRAEVRLPEGESSRECSQWCYYQGYDVHVSKCSRKGPVR